MIDQASQEFLLAADRGASNFGPSLRRVREQSGVTLREIADATKLSLMSLRALEEGRIEQLPGGIFRRAIVRAYAERVGLNADAVVRAFVARHPDDVPSAVVTTVAEPANHTPAILRGAVSLLGAAVPIIAGVAYFATGTAGSDSPRYVADVTGARRTALATPVEPASVTDTNALAMLISVSAQTRLAVIADGREVIARQLEPGEVVRVNVADDVLLMGDNAGAVQFSINGRAGRALGDNGVPLSARIPRDDYLSWLIRP